MKGKNLLLHSWDFNRILHNGDIVSPFLTKPEVASLALAQIYYIPLAEYQKETMFTSVLVLKLHPETEDKKVENPAVYWIS